MTFPVCSGMCERSWWWWDVPLVPHRMWNSNLTSSCRNRRFTDDTGNNREQEISGRTSLQLTHAHEECQCHTKFGPLVISLSFSSDTRLNLWWIFSTQAEIYTHVNLIIMLMLGPCLLWKGERPVDLYMLEKLQIPRSSIQTGVLGVKVRLANLRKLYHLSSMLVVASLWGWFAASAKNGQFNEERE